MKNRTVWRFGVVGLGLAFVLSGLLWAMISFFPQEEEKLEIMPVEELAENNQATEIFVDVVGAVINPGLYKLPANTRIQDALVMAGGLSGEADREYLSKYINLAQKISDGMKLYFPFVDEAKQEILGNSTAESPTRQLADQTAKLNINTVTVAELDTLWGIGPARAQAIIDNRPYVSIEELSTKKIIPSNVYERIKEEVGVY